MIVEDWIVHMFPSFLGGFSNSEFASMVGDFDVFCRWSGAWRGVWMIKVVRHAVE